MKCCINGGNVIKLLKFEIQKCGQILCAHKPYFLMPGHIYRISYTLRCSKNVLNNAVTTVFPSGILQCTVYTNILCTHIYHTMNHVLHMLITFYQAG